MINYLVAYYVKSTGWVSTGTGYEKWRLQGLITVTLTYRPIHQCSYTVNQFLMFTLYPDLQIICISLVVENVHNVASKGNKTANAARGRECSYSLKIT